MGDYKGLLYARPSFLEGFARIVDLSGTLNEYNKSDSGEQADLEAMEADWHSIGQDFRQAIESYKASHPEMTNGSK